MYRSSANMDWAFEKIRTPSSCLALALNLVCFYLRIPRVFRAVTVMVEPVYGCNLRCRTCWGVLHFHEDARPRFLEWDIFTKFVDELPRSVEAITFSLMGEPLLHPRLDDMIEYAHQKAFRTILFTNGTLLAGERLDRLARTHLDVLNVSFETDPGNAARMRGIDLEELRANIRAFIQEKRHETAVKLSLVAHPDNLDRVETVAKDWADVTEHIKVSPQLGVCDEAGPAPLCLEPWRGNLNLYTNGDISPCCCDWFIDLCIGNVRTQRVGDILRGEAYRNLLRRFLAGDPPTNCLHCREFTVPGAPLRLKKRFRKPKG